MRHVDGIPVFLLSEFQFKTEYSLTLRRNTRVFEKAVEHVDDSNTNCSWGIWYSFQKPGKEKLLTGD